MPYLAISSAALAVSASASAGVTPADSALASSFRTRSSRAAAASEPGAGPRAGPLLAWPPLAEPRGAEPGLDASGFTEVASCPEHGIECRFGRYPDVATFCLGVLLPGTLVAWGRCSWCTLPPAGPGSPDSRAGDGGLTPAATPADAAPSPTLSPMAVQMAPSILSADFARLADEAAAVTGVADWLHVDVMDNHFVPNLTLGLPVVEALLKHAGLPLDCHLMIDEPERWAPAYAEAGARNVTIHAEAASSPVRTLRMIRSAGARAGLGINPATPVEPYADLLPEIDMLLLMTVEPGFGGQPFLDMVLPKLRRARGLVSRAGAAVWLQVDGGVSVDTIERCADAGADVFVAGSAVYGADDPAAAVQALRAQAQRATARASWPG